MASARAGARRQPFGRGRAVRAVWGVAAARGRLPSWARQTVDTSDLVQDTLQHTFARLGGFKAGYLHGDVEPSNIGFMLSGLPKLLDFGLAREPNDADTQGGTLRYLSPEVLSGLPAEQADDSGPCAWCCTRWWRVRTRSQRPSLTPTGWS